MDCLTDLEELSMTMAQSMKVVLIMGSPIATRHYSYEETGAFIVVRLEITKLTVTVSYRLQNSFIKESGTTISHMEKHDKFTILTLSMKDSL